MGKKLALHFISTRFKKKNNKIFMICQCLKAGERMSDAELEPGAFQSHRFRKPRSPVDPKQRWLSSV